MYWVPYVIVIGDTEAESGELTVTVRMKSEPNKPYKISCTCDDLIQMIRNETETMPYRPLYTQKLLSMNPRYI